MSSVFVDFAGSVAAPFQFQPIVDGVSYNAIVTWNMFGQRYYLNLYDQSGNLVICVAVAASGPRIPASFTWSANVATALLQEPHNVPIGGIAQIRMSETGSAFDGDVEALAVDEVTLTYPLGGNPDTVTPATGVADFALNLLAGLGIGWLTYHWETQQFEYEGT